MKNLRSELRLILLLTLGGFGITYFVCPNCSTSAYNYGMVSIFSSLVWIFLWIGNDRLAHWLNDKISWVTSPIKRLVWGLLSTVVYTVGVMYLLTMLFNAIARFDIELNSEVLYITLMTTFAISVFMHGRAFLMNWRQAALDAETLRKETALAQYDALKSQLNPHFLFNSLNALTNLVYEDQNKAAQFIKQLSEVYRYVLDTRDKEVVSLAEEMKFARSYLFLQQIRFGDNLQAEISVGDETGKVAPLALQLLLENAINHNIVSQDQPLHIRIFREGGHIVVENSLQRKQQYSDATPGLGLDNIRRRYSFLTSEEVSIQAGSDKFIVRLPIIHTEA